MAPGERNTGEQWQVTVVSLRIFVSAGFPQTPESQSMLRAMHSGKALQLMDSEIPSHEIEYLLKKRLR